MIILVNCPSPVGCALEAREIRNNQLSWKTKNQCMSQAFSNTQRNEYMYLISQRQEGVALTWARGYPLSSTCAYFFIGQQILLACVYVCVRVCGVHICACAHGGRGGHQLSCSMSLCRLFETGSQWIWSEAGNCQASASGSAPSADLTFAPRCFLYGARIRTQVLKLAQRSLSPSPQQTVLNNSHAVYSMLSTCQDPRFGFCRVVPIAVTYWGELLNRGSWIRKWKSGLSTPQHLCKK